MLSRTHDRHFQVSVSAANDGGLLEVHETAIKPMLHLRPGHGPYVLALYNQCFQVPLPLFSFSLLAKLSCHRHSIFLIYRTEVVITYHVTIVHALTM